MESPEKRKNVDAAKLAEQAERYDDMVKHMKAVAEMKIPLSSEVSAQICAHNQLRWLREQGIMGFYEN